MAQKRTFIKNEHGRIIGMTDLDTTNGDITARDENGVILGFYRKKEGFTKSFTGRILALNDITTSLITDAYNKKHQK